MSVPAPILAGRDCPLCGREGTYWCHHEGVVLRTCCNREVVLSWPWVSEHAYEMQYQSSAYHHDAALALGCQPHTERFNEHRAAARCRFDWLQSRGLAQAGDYLWDIGAGNGTLVAEGRERGLHTFGLEPSKPMCDWALANHNLALTCGDWKELNSHADLVTATDVFEHLTQPDRFLWHVRRYAHNLYIETPEWRPSHNVTFRHIKPREHPVLYSEAAICEISSRNGWAVREIYRPIPSKLAIWLCARD